MVCKVVGDGNNNDSDKEKNEMNRDVQVSEWKWRHGNLERVVLVEETHLIGTAGENFRFGTIIEIDDEGRIARFWGHYGLGISEALNDYDQRRGAKVQLGR